MVVEDENANVSIEIDGEMIDKVNAFKYLGAIKTNTDSWSEDIQSRRVRPRKLPRNWIQFGKIEEYENYSRWNW